MAKSIREAYDIESLPVLNRPNVSLPLFECLERLGHLVRHEQRQVATENGLKLVQLEALQYLRRANRYSNTPVAVAEALGLTKGTVSQTLTALENKGLMRKRADPKDKRVVHCEPTHVGHRLADSGLPPELLEAAALSFNSAARTALVAGLEQLLRAAQRERGFRTFGVCRTCRHFHRENEHSYSCGLTEERLLPEESLLRCREHENSEPHG